MPITVVGVSMLMNAKGFAKNAGSIILTVLVVSLLLVSGPASAVEIKLDGLNGQYKQGTEVEFKADVRINHGKTSGELLPIQYANVTFTFPDKTKKTCTVMNDGTVIGCGFLSAEIEVSGHDNYGPGNGTAYDANGTKHDLGYGYGYGYGNKETHVKYEFELDTKGFKTGDYSAVVDVYAGTTSPMSFSGSTKFSIFSKSPKGKGKGKDYKDGGDKNNGHDSDED